INNRSEPFGNFTTNGRGEEIGKKHYAISNVKKSNSIPFIIGEDIKRYNIKCCNYLDLDNLDFELKPAANYKENQILIRKTGTVINAVVDTNGIHCNQNVYIFQILVPKKYNPYYFLGILNSRVIGY